MNSRKKSLFPFWFSKIHENLPKCCTSIKSSWKQRRCLQIRPPAFRNYCSREGQTHLELKYIHPAFILCTESTCKWPQCWGNTPIEKVSKNVLLQNWELPRVLPQTMDTYPGYLPRARTQGSIHSKKAIVQLWLILKCTVPMTKFFSAIKSLAYVAIFFPIFE